MLVNVEKWPKEKQKYLSQAMFAQAYGLAISSSAFRVLARCIDWASSEVASSISGFGRSEESCGISDSNTFSIWVWRLMLTAIVSGIEVGDGLKR